MTASYGTRLIERERCAYLRPMVLHADSPERAVAMKEYMFPFVSVVECPQKDMLKAMGSTLVCTALTGDPHWVDQLTSAVHIDRLNVGPIPTSRLNWLQPHEGNLIDFLFRSRAYQIAPLNVPTLVAQKWKPICQRFSNSITKPNNSKIRGRQMMPCRLLEEILNQDPRNTFCRT